MERVTDPAEYVKLIIHDKDADVKGEMVDNKILKIEYLAPNNWLTRGSFLARTEQIMPAVFEKFPKIIEINLTGLTTFKDERGHSSVGKFMMVRFSRENSATIDWKSIDANNVMKVADYHYDSR
jgi:hypothetical protein